MDGNESSAGRPVTEGETYLALPVQEEGEQVMKGGAAPIIVPSGQHITLQDVVWNAPGPDGLTLRFRFIAPDISAEGGVVDFETASQDMLWLCQNYALPRVSNTGPQPAQIIISLSDTETPFGQAAPDATQFFEAYSLKDGICTWEVY
jgi:hypothetical protein